jgi:16S rRNA (adenine1518-N6/adenine1519-N6)-dimethyltransferase
LSSHRPQKKWGQNFLRNSAAVDRIVEAIGADADELILEIGPGEGALTRRLAELPNPILALEIDPSLAQRLRAQFAGSRVTVVEGDATDAPLPDRPFSAVGNLPYNAGTPILRRVIAATGCRRAVFMLQKEVADRLLASPGTGEYGFLTLYVELFARSRLLMTLNPGAFYPRPKVRSAVVVLDTEDPATATPRDELIELISVSFRMRRKTLVNNLTSFRGLSKPDAEAAVRKAELPGNIRAEALSLADFDRLARNLTATGG